MRADARRRLDDLLLARVIDGLSAAEVRELEELHSLHRDVDADAYERTAAAICLAALVDRFRLRRLLYDRRTDRDGACDRRRIAIGV